jgi:protoheme IX farnesyltransferase
MSDLAVTPSKSTTDASDAVASVGDFISLLKPRVMSLVIFTALVGIVIAPGAIHPVVGFAALLCIAVGAGASGALNMWYDADIDAVMSRTQSRAIPEGRVTREDAFTFGATLALFSVAMMGVLVNWLAASLLAFTIFFYVVVYTMWLKRRTAQNIVIGGAAGALPPVIGWAAATGDLALEPLILFAIIFLWTPPHFWALSLVKTDDYARANVPMLPVVAGERATRRQIFIYSLLLVAASALPVIAGFAGLAYAIVMAALSVGFVVIAAQLLAAPSDEARIRPLAMRLFGFSILFLFAAFAALLIEGLAGLPPVWSA